MPLLKCDTCGVEIKKKPSDIKKHNFCSRKCYYQHRARNQINASCEKCGKPLCKPPSKATKRNFCSRKCHMETLNAELNPYRMTSEVREKLRLSRLGSGKGEGYSKTYGTHTHRIVAEKKLGRKLLKGEVVHHIDKNKRNNKPENLMIFKSQKEHAAWHAREKVIK